MLLHKLVLTTLACSLPLSMVSYAGPITLTATATEVGATNLPIDSICPAYTVNPSCSVNSNLQVVNYTASNGFDFTANPLYSSVYGIDSIQITFTMAGVDTTTAPYKGMIRIWFSGAGTGVSADGFDTADQTLTFTIPAGNSAFSSIASTIRSTGKLTGQLRDNVTSPVTFAGTATITVNAETPEPSAAGLCGLGLALLALPTMRSLRRM